MSYGVMNHWQTGTLAFTPTANIYSGIPSLIGVHDIDTVVRDEPMLFSAYDSLGYELEPLDLNGLAKLAGFERPGQFIDEPLSKVVERAKELDHTEEGFVLNYANGFRLKIKGDEYMRLHRLISNVTPLAVWDMLKNGDDPETVRRELPEEMQKDFDNIVSILLSEFDKIVSDVRDAYIKTINWTDKEVGLWLDREIKERGEIGSYVRKFLFRARKGSWLADVFFAGTRARRDAFKMIRPTGNELKGYTPSSAMDRFESEAA